MQEKLFELMMAAGQKQELQEVLNCNDKSEEFGLALTKEDAEMLVQCRKTSLKEQRRVEFGGGILKELIDVFCDSQFLEQDSYAETLSELQDIFYLYKNESEDNLTDDELLTAMRELFEDICFGDIAYLRETCLERFTRAIRAGYRGYEQSGAAGEYTQFSEEERWDRQMYWDTLFDQLS